MGRYRKLPVEIEAEKVSDILEGLNKGTKELPRWIIEAYRDIIIHTVKEDYFYVQTLEGTVVATKQDYLVKGVDGELYPCKIEIFEKTYERLED